MSPAVAGETPARVPGIVIPADAAPAVAGEAPAAVPLMTIWVSRSEIHARRQSADVSVGL